MVDQAASKTTLPYLRITQIRLAQEMRGEARNLLVLVERIGFLNDRPYQEEWWIMENVSGTIQFGELPAKIEGLRVVTVGFSRVINIETSEGVSEVCCDRYLVVGGNGDLPIPSPENPFEK